MTLDEAGKAGLVKIGSREETLDREMTRLIGLIARGIATPDDMAMLAVLQHERVRRMTPQSVLS